MEIVLAYFQTMSSSFLEALLRSECKNNLLFVSFIFVAGYPIYRHHHQQQQPYRRHHNQKSNYIIEIITHLTYMDNINSVDIGNKNDMMQ